MACEPLRLDKRQTQKERAYKITPAKLKRCDELAKVRPKALSIFSQIIWITYIHCTIKSGESSYIWTAISRQSSRPSRKLLNPQSRLSYWSKSAKGISCKQQLSPEEPHAVGLLLQAQNTPSPQQHSLLPCDKPPFQPFLGKNRLSSRSWLLHRESLWPNTRSIAAVASGWISI